MRMRLDLRGAILVWATLGSLAGAHAETPEMMMAVCRLRAHDAFKLRLPDIDTKYEGQRVDGSHAVNGTAFLPAGERTFQCSFNRTGKRIIKFVANPAASKKPARSDAPSAVDQLCLQAVSKTTNNGEVAVLSRETSQAATAIMIGVGPQRAPWRCLVSRGVVTEVISTTDEGKL